MKKFSKKLVSRCIYCNVLQATEPSILSDFLDKGGWETINTWLTYAKTSTSSSVVIELLKLCKLLPMTVERLKENNTAKLIKSLSKHDDSEVRKLSTELVNKWMSIIKGVKVADSGEKKKKKEKNGKTEKSTSIKEDSKVPPKSPKESPKAPSKIKSLKRASTEKEAPKVDDMYEDVKIDPEPLMPPTKRARPDRPKTAKIYQKKFRATGLEEETPLPRNISKKTSTVDKSAIANAKSTLKLNSSLSAERVTEKKIKPESLMSVSDNTKGIKVIPAKPRPTVLHESASFMDALVSQPAPPVKRKKKVAKATSPSAASTSPSNSAASPTSPSVAPPKFQFYKDTLELNEETKNEEADKKDNDNPPTEDTESSEKENEVMDTNEGGSTPPNEDSMDASNSTSASSPTKSTPKKVKAPVDPNNLTSILSYGKRKGKKKVVQWVEDENIKEIFYFEMDDTERENVSRRSSFYDLKSIEMKREREAMELAKRGGLDKIEVLGRWWTIPILVECPPPIVERGCNSTEKAVDALRQQSTLQEIYFTREMIPDSPHEPDLEIHPPKEPMVIPFDENNSISTVNDFSNYKLHKVTNSVLPDILATIMKVTTGQTASATPQNLETPQLPVPPSAAPALTNPPIPNPFNPESVPMAPNVPFPPVSNPNMMPSPLPNGMIPPGAVPMFNQPNPAIGEWRTLEDVSNPEMWMGFNPRNPNMPPNQFVPPHLARGMRPPMVPIRPGFVPRYKGRKLCRHFAGGHCRFGNSCSFLHPGVNGPPI